MLRSDRLVITAIAGLILIGASQPSKIDAGGKEAQPQNTQAQALSAADVGSPTSSSQDTGCDKGTDNRASDLCAQWKAADAARDSAEWAWWQVVAGFIGLVVGGGTLIAAWRAAHWAKKAAEHTETAAIEAKKSAEIAERSLIVTQRAMLYVRPRADINVDKTKTRITSFHIYLNVENIGQTEARNLRSYISGGVFELPMPQSHEYDGVFDTERDILPARAPVTSFGQAIIGEDIPDVLAHKKRIMIWGSLEYQDIFSETPRRINFCFAVRLMQGVDGPTDYKIYFDRYGPHNRTYDIEEKR